MTVSARIVTTAGVAVLAAWVAVAGNRAVAQPPPDPAPIRVGLSPFLSGLADPVAMAAPDDGSGRLFFVEKRGTIQVVRDGQVLNAPFLDVRERVDAGPSERGLLGLAFHPRFSENGTFVVAYTAKEPAGRVTYSRFRVSADPDLADPSSEREIIGWPHPRGNHNGGHVAFGPDGYLYLGTGDGGGGGDPDQNGQNGRSLLGKMLRLDIDGGEPYGVPADNPFVGRDTVRDEIWALGLRNPWRYGFDRETGDLYIADVGQNRLEEVNFEPAGDPGGRNYGWNVMEGSECYQSVACDRTGFTLPIAEYSHDLGCSITGGHVYRGTSYPGLAGAYFYADFCSHRIWALARDATGDWRADQVGTGSGGIQSFGEDAAGELYVLTADGNVHRLVDERPEPPTPEPTAAAPPTAAPTSETSVPEEVAPLSLPWLDR